MAVLAFASNTLAGFTANTSAIVEGTSTTYYDSTVTDRFITLVSTENDTIQSAPFAGGALTTAWLHFDVFSTGGGVTSTLLVALNSAGVPVVRLYGTPSSLQVQYWNGSAWVAAGATWIVAQSTVTTYDVQIVCGASGSVNVWQSGAQVSAVSGLNAAVTNVLALQILNLGNGTTRVSQVIASDTSTRDSKLYARSLLAVSSTNADGSGTVSDVTDASDTTAAVLSATGLKRSYTRSSLTVPSGYVVGGVAVNVRGRVGTAGPADAFGLVRSAGTNYLSSALGMPTAYGPRCATWVADPATGAAFTQTALNALEVGIAT